MEQPRLSDLTAGAKRLALVGLAKNTGKTVALAALLRELEAQGRPVGVTSAGRDGEARDVIDRRIEKPQIVLAKGSLVATTDSLLRASRLTHELMEHTGIRTPLGQVLIARLKEPGAIEVAGPSAGADVRAVSDTILAQGAGHNRARLIELPPRFALTSDETQIGDLLDTNPSASRLIAGGALPAQFLDALARVTHRRPRKFAVVAEDPTKVFLTDPDRRGTPATTSTSKLRARSHSRRSSSPPRPSRTASTRCDCRRSCETQSRASRSLMCSSPLLQTRATLQYARYRARIPQLFRRTPTILRLNR